MGGNQEAWSLLSRPTGLLQSIPNLTLPMWIKAEKGLFLWRDQRKQPWALPIPLPGIGLCCPGGSLPPRGWHHRWPQVAAGTYHPADSCWATTELFSVSSEWPPGRPKLNKGLSEPMGAAARPAGALHLWEGLEQAGQGRRGEGRWGVGAPCRCPHPSALQIQNLRLPEPWCHPVP